MEEAVIKRVLPHSTEAEQSVIGSMLMNRDAILAAAELIDGRDFYNSQYGLLFDAMTELNNEGQPVDPVTLQARLIEKGAPPEVSGLEYIADLISAVPTSANVRYYAKIVADRALSRRIIKMNEELMNACYAGTESVDEIVDRAEKAVFSLAENGRAEEVPPIDEVMVSVLKRISAAARMKGAVTGVPTGFADLDYKTAGFQKSDLILIAARPSMGKTAFVLNIAQYVAIRKHLPVVFFSLEMSSEQIGNRLVAMESRIDAQKLRSGNLNGNEWMELTSGAKVIADSNLLIDDTPGISVNEIRSKCRKFKLEKRGLGMIVIDYLQLMSSSRHSESRQQEISEISRSLKALARELDVPVLALSQLSRAVEKRDDKRPMLSDLRESGAIEQDADVVMFIYREDYYVKDTDKKGVTEIIIAKQRNGPVGTVELVFLPQYTKFVDLARQRDLQKQ
ncbi:MAG: replicative DNA helicase [Lachnospiraceae bacterium]